MQKLSLTKAPVAVGESREEFTQMLRIVSVSYEPCTAYELFLVTRMATIHWRLMRLEQHNTERVTAGRLLQRSGVKPRGEGGTRYMPNGIDDETIASSKLEKHLHEVLAKLRQEFNESRTRRGMEAARRNEPGYASALAPSSETDQLHAQDELSALAPFSLAKEESTVG